MSFRESLLYFHQAGATGGNITIKTGPGVLHTLSFNTIGATVAPLTISDGATVIGVHGPVASSQPYSVILDVRFANSLVINGLGATEDITIAFE